MILRFLHIFQLCGYRRKKFLAWYFSRRIFHKNANIKVPLKFTPRVRRLVVTMCILFTCSCGILLLFAPVTLVMASYVNAPIEIFITRRYLRRAKAKLFSSEYAHVIRIGITGSYGKTTCKNLLAQMLSQKYKVLQSPESYNTPTGFSRTVLEHLTPDTKVLIMEMGARRRGDIKQMCKLFRPHHGILTSVGTAHLETFKTLESIDQEKHELLRAIPDGGIKLDNTKLKLGNIELCSRFAVDFGLTEDEIKNSDLKSPPHRLELSVASNGVRILDDSYNSNPDGCRLALERLAELKGDNRAVVLTPGMVELGKIQYAENKTFAKEIATIADHVIIVGDTNKKALRDGLVEKNFDMTKVDFVKTLDDAKEIFPTILSSGDILLIENDLPDNY